MTTIPPVVRIRPYRPEDRAALYDICIRTGHEGGDARHLYDDHDLLPDIFAAPYVAFDPRLCFVLDDGERAVGYVVATADTAAFVAWFRERWLPGLDGRHPRPAPGAPEEGPTPLMLRLLHNPERMLVPELAGYPAHLHIDILPGHQGAGHGRGLLTRLFDALSERGVPGVHLGMAPANVRARAFYDRMGFHEVRVPGAVDVTYLGRWLDGRDAAAGAPRGEVRGAEA
ncbi:GNAT family N-acetyltransferase [Streptomyces capparidis]